MAEIKSRANNPLPGIEYSEIHIPDEQNLGTGKFLTVLEPKSMSRINPIISTIANEPVFKLIVSINIAEEMVNVMLGKDDSSPPISRERFKLPKKINPVEIHAFDTIFKEWKIEDIKMDGNNLEKISAD